MWDNHVKEQQTGIVSTQYTSDFGLGDMELLDLILEGIDPYIPYRQEIADTIVQLLVKLREPVVENEQMLRTALLLIKQYCNGKASTVAGAYILNFVYDENKAAYHSKVITWQKYFGYNDVYDHGFRIGSSMHFLRLGFSINTDIPHYKVVDFEMPMTLSLYNYYRKDSIVNVFNWAPEEKQWWITGFSGQNPQFMELDEDVMVVKGAIDLTGHEELYKAMKKADNVEKSLELIFDRDGHTVWINWYEGVM